jgi:hypothetical protein
MKELFLKQLADEFQKIGNDFGFQKLITRSCINGWISEIYVINDHALQIEVDWMEYDLFMYAVYLKDKKLPPELITYRYDDGQWCRKHLLEIYKTKLPAKILKKGKGQRYSIEQLNDFFEFYRQLIYSNPKVLTDFFESI